MIRLKFWRSWPVHNLVAHPLMEILSWVRLGRIGDKIHNGTIPENEYELGRG